MSATITDYFNKASNMNGSYPPVAEVASARAVGGSVLTCDDLSGWATATPVHFSTFTLASDGTVDTSTQTDWKGIVVGNTITEMTRLAGAADSGNASGDKVELNPTIGWLDDLITGILVSHKQNGGLKDSVVTEDTIATGAVTSSKVAAGAISSYDKISDGVIQARNIDPIAYKYAEISSTATYGTSESNIPIEISSQTNNDFCTVSNNIITFTKTGLYLVTLLAGRSTSPGANSRIDVGVPPAGQTSGRIVFVAKSVLSGDRAQGYASNIVPITSGSTYAGRVFDPTKNLGSCDTFKLRITPIL